MFNRKLKEDIEELRNEVTFLKNAIINIYNGEIALTFKILKNLKWGYKHIEDDNYMDGIDRYVSIYKSLEISIEKRVINYITFYKDVYYLKVNNKIYEKDVTQENTKKLYNIINWKYSVREKIKKECKFSIIL